MCAKKNVWGKKGFPFILKDKTIETDAIDVLFEFYKVEHVTGNMYKILGYKDSFIDNVYNKCYGMFVNVYQNFMIDKHVSIKSFFFTGESRSIAKIVSKSCFSVAVIDVANLLKERSDQVYSLNTLEILLQDKYPNFKPCLAKYDFSVIKEVVMKLRDQFYAHRDFYVKTESDKIPIWDIADKLKDYFSEIVAQTHKEPFLYNKYLRIEQKEIEQFLNFGKNEKA